MRAETKYTPGPWEANGKSVRTRCHDASGHAPNGYEGGICNCLGGWGANKAAQDAKAKANAQLIAAAPELLEALINAVEDEPNACFAESARAVIAKAKGEAA